MVKVLVVVAAIAVCCANAKNIHAPLPPEVFTAKTVFIINHTGREEATDRAYQELLKWGRFAVVSDLGKANIILVVSSQEHSLGATAQTYGNNTYVRERSALDVTVGFFLPGHDEPFFSETERASLFQKSATKRCVDDLKKRIEETDHPHR